LAFLFSHQSQLPVELLENWKTRVTVKGEQ
jgi:hypothetical protein